MSTDAPGRLQAIQAMVSRASKRFDPVGRPVKLVAVSKTFPPEVIEPLLAAGQRVFGENRVQEAKDKWPALRERYPDWELHLLGPLQTNNPRDAAVLLDLIETVDRDRLA